MEKYNVHTQKRDRIKWCKLFFIGVRQLAFPCCQVAIMGQNTEEDTVKAVFQLSVSVLAVSRSWEWQL